MASGNSPFGSVLGVVVIILAIAAAAYVIIEKTDDNELEIDIGLLHDPVPVVAPVLVA